MCLFFQDEGALIEVLRIVYFFDRFLGVCCETTGDGQGVYLIQFEDIGQNIVFTIECYT